VNFALQGGVTCDVVVTGYSNAQGPYQFDITEHVPCVFACPPGAQFEGEPPLIDGYLDAQRRLQQPRVRSPVPGDRRADLQRRGGGDVGSSGWTNRDTDWFEALIPAGGELEITGDAEFPSYMLQLGPLDCGNVDVIQDHFIGPCEPALLASFATRSRFPPSR